MKTITLIIIGFIPFASTVQVDPLRYLSQPAYSGLYTDRQQDYGYFGDRYNTGYREPVSFNRVNYASPSLNYAGSANSAASHRLSVLQRYYSNILKSGGYGSSQAASGNTRYIPVVKKAKKKQKIISIDKGLHIPGGTQAFGKFTNLKSCMKACASSPSCFAGDYNPWLGKCYFHSNQTACNSMESNSKLVHFKKVPCTVPETTKFKIHFGTQLYGGIAQQGVKSMADCLKKCVSAGGGIASAPADLATVFRGGQICFGIDYNFGTHRCFFHTRLFSRLADALPLCPIDTTDILTPVDLHPNSAVVNVIICPSN